MKMMKPVGNENVGSDKKKWAVIGGIGTAVLALAVCLCVLVLRSEDDLTVQQDDYSQAAMLEWEGNNDAMVKTLASTTIVGDKVPLSDFPFDDEGNLKEEPDVVKNGGYVAVYTGIKTNQDDLVELLKDTIKETHSMVQDQLQAEKDWQKELGRALKSGEEDPYLITHQLLSPVIKAVRDKGTTIDRMSKMQDEPTGAFPSACDEWTYWDFMGVVGDWMMHRDIYESIEDVKVGPRYNTMHRFVWYDVFDFNTDLMTNFELKGVADTRVPAYETGNEDIYWEVNYQLEFDYADPTRIGDDGKPIVSRYRALICNKNLQYWILDVTLAEDPIVPGSKDENPIPKSIESSVDEFAGAPSLEEIKGDPNDTSEIPYTFDTSLFKEGFDPDDLSKSVVTLNPKVNYWDFDGHLKSHNDGMDGKYREWCESNMDWVNQYISTHEGCTLDEYLKQNCKFDK